MKKSQNTYDKIIDAALKRAIHTGLEGISFAMVANMVGMSKSGLFAHFDSKEHLQQAIVQEAIERFQAIVVAEALEKPAGIERLRAFYKNYIEWIAGQHETGGCPFMPFVQEFDDRPGPIHDLLAQSSMQWHKTLGAAIKEAQKNGQIPDTAKPRQLVFELNGAALSFQMYLRLLNDKDAVELAMQAFERIIRQK